MPYQNRVQPDGQIIAHPARGSFMGNRGILHDAEGHLTHRRWAHKAWVTCVLSFKGRRRHPLMQAGHYTELFFHDEAVAFAAGHRPCAECRRVDYNRFRDAAGIGSVISDFDAKLHTDRAVPRVWQQRLHKAQVADLPDGTFVMDEDGTALLLRTDALFPFAPPGYGPPRPRPKTGAITVLTPALLVDVLRAGYALTIKATD